MTAYLSIGDFSRATHLTVKTLRHYHQAGLLAPADVDPHSGYRRYTVDQIATAQVIKRFRNLDMPLDDIAAVLTAPDLRTRNERITAHLNRLEDALGRTQRAVASLRDLLQPATAAAIELRTMPATPAAAITETVDATAGQPWLQGALAELHATVTAQHNRADGTPGGIFADDIFTDHNGETTIFLPCAEPISPMGRVAPTTIPAAELAVIMHVGPPSDSDRAYGALAAYVTDHALAVAGPIREYYVAGQHESPDPADWRTEIGWPIFHPGTAD